MKLKPKHRIKFLIKLKPRHRNNLKNRKNLKNRIFSICSISAVIISMFINDKLKYSSRVNAFEANLLGKNIQIQLPPPENVQNNENKTATEELTPQPTNPPAQSNIKTITMEEYLTGVLAGEMSPEAEKEALITQALVAHTYAIKNISKQPFLTSSAFQVYASEETRRKMFGKKFEKYEDKLKEIVKSIISKVITYKGKPISAVYFTKSSGKTQNAEDVWGYKYDYLVSVDSPEGNDQNLETEKRINYDKLFETIHQKHNEAKQPDPKEKPKAIEIDNNKTVAGHIKSAKIFGIEFKANQVRTLLKLPSTNFSTTFDSEKNEFVFKCKGDGHCVGLSQNGAVKMAKEGKKHDEIIKHYYKNVEITDIEKLNLEDNDKNKEVKINA